MRTALFNPYDLFILLLCFFLIGACSERKIPPKAVKGVLDLRDWNFERDGNINLDGEWECYWEEFPTVGAGGELLLPEEKKDYIRVPGDWNGHIVRRNTIKAGTLERKLNGEGYDTYRLNVLLSESSSLGFRIPIDNVCKFYINNMLVLETEDNGIKRESSIPKRTIKYYNSTKTYTNLNISIALSNYQNNKVGLRSSILIGKNESIFKYNLNQVALDLFITAQHVNCTEVGFMTLEFI
jgi:hypothetical protein